MEESEVSLCWPWLLVKWQVTAIYTKIESYLHSRPTSADGDMS